jgi:hypothetical protein
MLGREYSEWNGDEDTPKVMSLSQPRAALISFEV